MVTLTGTVIADESTEYARVRIVGGRLTFAPGPPGDGHEQRIEGWILPGLVDVHCHVGYSPEGVCDEPQTLSQARMTARTGVLLTRDAGMPIDTRFLQEFDDVPRIIRAGQHVARPRRYIRELPVDVEDPDDLPRVLAEQALAGDGWVKLVADWIDRDLEGRADLTPLWTPAQLTAAFAAAHDNGARVMVHTFAHDSIQPLLDAGVDCIEHGTGMTRAHMEQAASAGVPVTPTLLQMENFPAIAEHAEGKFPIYAAHMRRLYEQRFARVRDLYEAGVQLLVGSDAGGGVAHGELATEASLLVEAGVPAAAVVGAASYHARTYLGAAGITEGAPADVVVYPEDPRQNIGVLAHPTAVFRGGRQIR